MEIDFDKLDERLVKLNEKFGILGSSRKVHAEFWHHKGRPQWEFIATTFNAAGVCFQGYGHTANEAFADLESKLESMSNG